MNTNERIARWVGIDTFSDGELGPLVVVDGVGYTWNPADDCRPWHFTVCEGGPPPLLAEIERRGKHDSFLRVFLLALVAELRGERGVVAREDDGSEWVEIGTAWMIRRATHAQLSAALVAVIGE